VQSAANATRSAWLLVAALGLGVFVGGFDQTFVVPVLSRILGDLDIAVDEFGQASWIVNGYLLGYTVALPLMGRLADVHGHFRVFVLGLVIFMGGSVLVALSPNLPLLTLARALTAVGGGALVPVALAMAAHALPPSQRVLGLGAVSTLDDSSSLVGPLWGTLIGVWIGWRGLFWMNIVLALPVLIAVLVLARRQGEPARAEGRVDFGGGLLLAGALAALTFALADASARAAWQTVSLYLGATVLFLGFVARELRATAPLIELRMFRSRSVAIANAVFLLEGVALITALVNVPLMTDVLWGQSGAGPGLMLGRMVLFMALGGLVGGALATLVGYRTMALASFALTAAGLFAMAAWAEQPGEAARWIALGLAGFGFTLADASLYATVIEAVEVGRRASATALLQLFQTLGMVIGMALLASEGLGRFDRRAADLFEAELFDITDRQLREVVHQTLDETFVVAGALMVVAALLSLWLGGGWRHGRRFGRAGAEADVRTGADPSD